MKAVALLICSCTPLNWHLEARVIGMHSVKTGSFDMFAMVIPKHSVVRSPHRSSQTSFPSCNVKIISCVRNWPNTDAMFVRCGDWGDCCHGDSGFWLWGKNIRLTVLAFGRGLTGAMVGNKVEGLESVCKREMQFKNWRQTPLKP